MGRIQLTDPTMDIIVKMSDGNMGATMAIMDIIEQHEQIDPQAMLGGIGAILALDDMGIYGTDIYVLYSDKCQKDVRKFLVLMRANQLGFLSQCKLKEMSSDQMMQINLTVEELTELDNKVCEQLEGFKKAS